MTQTLSAMEKAFAALQQLYDTVAERIAGIDVSCTGCGECCHFETVDHVLYATRLETEYFLLRVREDGISPTKSCRPGRCPFQVDERCGAHGMRPLGCRLHFCERAGATPDKDEALAQLSIDAHEKLKQIHEEYGIEWQYGPFLDALAAEGLGCRNNASPRPQF